MSNKFHSFDSERTGELVAVPDVIGEFLSQQQAAKENKAEYASDMDGSMVDNDVGITVFMEKLTDPTFWTYSSETFSRILLPPHYQAAITEGQNGSIEKLPPTVCDKVLNLHTHICELYALKKRLMSDGILTINDPVVNEFARTMYEFDQILMQVDQALSTVFVGKLLMRIRFFAGKNRHAVEKLTDKVMKRPENAPDRYINLAMHSEHGAYLPPVCYDRYVPIIEGTRQCIGALDSAGIRGRVVTTNLHEIASHVVRNSPYAQFFPNPEESIVATRLRRALGDRRKPSNDRRRGSFYQSETARLPVWGPEKVKRILEVTRRSATECLAAIGDSPSNDGPMLKMALENNGLAFLVGDNYEAVRRRFNDWFEKVAAANPQASSLKNRIVVIESKRR